MFRGYIEGKQIELDDRCMRVGPAKTPVINDLELVKEFYSILKSRNSSSNTVVDIGSNTGVFCFLPLVDSSFRSFAFEPNPATFDILNNNIRLNNLEEKIKARNMGVFNKDSVLKLKVPVNDFDCGLCTFGDGTRFKYDNYAGDFKEVEVECKTLDSICEEGNIDTVQAIKIDAEGAELFIIQGAKETITKHKPLILLEYDNQNTVQFGYNREEIKELLTSYGYTNFKMHGPSDIFAID